MRHSIVVRPAVDDDANAIAELLGQLGYPTSVEDAQSQLRQLNAFPQTTALLAELDDEIAGLITGHVFPSIHAPALVAWITTLVVNDRHLQRGVGRTLCAAVEAWAQTQGATRVSVTSGLHRSGAHTFYESIGYARTGVRLSRSL